MKRSTPMSRNTPLTATTGLSRGTGLQPGEKTLGRGAPMSRVPAQRQTRTRRPGDDRGAPIPRWLADYVVERAEGCCDWCGVYCLNGWFSRQHRLPRGAGGRRDAHTAANLVLLCGSATSRGCHEKAERSAIREAQAAGFRLKPGEDPETVPILRHGLVRVHPTEHGWEAA